MKKRSLALLSLPPYQWRVRHKPTSSISDSEHSNRRSPNVISKKFEISFAEEKTGSGIVSVKGTGNHFRTALRDFSPSADHPLKPPIGAISSRNVAPKFPRMNFAIRQGLPAVLFQNHQLMA
jgi:hypothetical protein